MNYWLVKQEPTAYSFAQFLQDRSTAWTGIRNYQARNNLRAMAQGDTVFYYHSVEGREIVGIAEVIRTAYPDPTAESGDWSCVDLQALKAFPKPVSLEQLKSHPVLNDLPLIRQLRLSVMPLSADEAQLVLQLGGLSSGSRRSRS